MQNSIELYVKGEKEKNRKSAVIRCILIVLCLSLLISAVLSAYGHIQKKERDEQFVYILGQLSDSFEWVNNNYTALEEGFEFDNLTKLSLTLRQTSYIDNNRICMSKEEQENCRKYYKEFLDDYAMLISELRGLDI